MHESNRKLNVCIPDMGKVSIGAQRYINVNWAGQGFDHDVNTFFIWPEKEMCEKIIDN